MTGNIQTTPKLARLCRIDPEIKSSNKIGRMSKSDDLKTGIISIFGLKLEMIETMLDGQLYMIVFLALTLDANVHVFLSNIEL